MLASFTAVPKRRQEGWVDDDLAEDVATLSYERALQAHARYRAPQADDHFVAHTVIAPSTSATEPISSDELLMDNVQTEPIAAQTSCETLPEPQASQPGELKVTEQLSTAEAVPFALERNLKCTSITMRLSKAESRQLRARAAEAGMTVSAYLRSCTFEAESLRAMVKDALAQLRSAPAQASEPVAAQPSPNWLQRIFRMWSFTLARRPSMEA